MFRTCISCLIFLLLLTCSQNPPEKVLANEVARESLQEQALSSEKPEQDGMKTDEKIPPAADTLLRPSKVTIADPRQASGGTISLNKKPEKQPKTSSKDNTAAEAPPSPAPVNTTATSAVVDPSPAAADEKTPPKITEAATASVPSHEPLDALLRKYVSGDGSVNYSQLKQDEKKLDEYLKTLKSSPPSDQWSRSEGKAYWLNAYNAFTLKLILQNWPVKRITDLHGGKPWDVKWIELGENTYSLNQIEHDIIRPRYQDPRIHFAVNCAAKSCPPLHNRAFLANGLNGTLAQLTRSFINSGYNDLATSPVKVSKIFEWYQEDFGNIREYLNRYAQEPISADAEITFKEYDWSLNGQ